MGLKGDFPSFSEYRICNQEPNLIHKTWSDLAMVERKKEIKVVPYNPEWKTEFEKIKTMINSYIGDLILTVEHVGSTSIEGLSAKPIIDLDVVIDSYDILPSIIDRLAIKGFEYEGNLGTEGREAFNRTVDDGCMKYHLYVCPKDGKGYLEHIAFRDYLRANGTARKEYEKLKLMLARTYRYDIDNYSDKKTEFVREILRKTLYRNSENIIANARRLREMYLSGLLGGEVMPEDANPGLPKNSALNYLYFTLPMALNYQRNSYTLWKSALSSYCDPETSEIYNPKYVTSIKDSKLRELLLKHKVALQPNKHAATWLSLCKTITEQFDGDIRNLFISCNWNIPTILEYIQKTHKKKFPYLSGPKICNYWLYVIDNYTDAKLIGKDALSIAPDTHVIQASISLGLIEEKYIHDRNIQSIVNQAWKDVLTGTELSLIDLHTPLWLWSRNGWKESMETN